MKVSIICNSDSDEKGISINSGKSIYEILEYYKFIKEVNILFINSNLDFFILKKEFIFSNTMEDFLHYYNKEHKVNNIVDYLKSQHIIILATHGQYGEDGILQKFLEDNNINYIGPSYFTASNTFNKLKTLETLWKNNISNRWTSEIFSNYERANELLNKHQQLCIKPNNGGSSIGVSIINNMEDFKIAINELNKKNYEILIEEVHNGVEFSVTIIGNKIYEPIEIVNSGIFTYEKKYFPTEKILYNYPAKFPNHIIEKIKKKSQEILNLFKCEYFLRVDGFYLNNKEIIFTDLNTIPGFQLNGLFFKYKNHFEVLHNILNIFFQKTNKNLCKKLLTYKKKFLLANKNFILNEKQNVFLIFGGDSSEQNVSIISGTNVLFNLYKSNKYNIYTFLLYKNIFYYLSYNEAFQNSIKDFIYIIKNHKNKDIFPQEDFVKLVKKYKGKIFIGLHGGIGEDGTLQELFEANHIKYTGSNSRISKLSMNKFNTIEYIKNNITNKNILKHIYFNKIKIIYDFKNTSLDKLKTIWNQLIYEINHNNSIKIFIKPNDDGCSVGAMILNNFQELVEYLQEIQNGNNNYKNYPLSLNSRDYLLCEYINMDKIHVNNYNIQYKMETGWIEGTIGFLKNRIFPPSVSISNDGLLTMEEKFLHGTGINLTPIPEAIMTNNNNIIIKKVIKHILKKIGFNSYCRVDFFYNIKSEKVNIIEVNSLPALTPATVLFQQAAYLNIKPSKLINTILNC